MIPVKTGCLSGNTLVTVERDKSDHQKVVRLDDFFSDFHTGNKRFAKGTVHIDFKIKTLVRTRSKLVKVYNVYSKGIQQVRTITLENGLSVTLTPNHEIGIGFTDFVANSSRMEGDLVRIEVGKDKIDFINIESISDLFEQEVYDVAREGPDQHFLANGIHVSNCANT